MLERTWDKYLSMQDRQHVALSDHQYVGFGSRPALLMIDLYRWVYGDRRQTVIEAYESWPGRCGIAAWDSLPHIRSLLAACRENSIPVIHISHLYEDLSGVASWANAYRRIAVATKAPSFGDVNHSTSGMFNIIEEFEPIEGEQLILRSAPSAFFGSPLMSQLTFLGVDTLIVAGESTSGCVRASVVDACSYRFRTIVAEECVFDRHEASHAINLFDMHQKYADVLATKDICAWAAQWATLRHTNPR